MTREERGFGNLSRSAMAYVLAGGRGSRLMELTDRRAKPAVYLRRQVAHHRFRAVQRPEFRHPPHRRRDPVQGAQPDPPPAARLELPAARAQRELRHPAGQPARLRDQWYDGTADAVYQNIDIIESYAPEYMVILAGDHIYKMDYELMLQQHVDAGADVTVGCLEVPRMEATRLRRDACRRDATGSSPSSKSRRTRRACRTSRTWRWPAWASMSSRREFLIDQLRRDAADPASSHDFGKDIIPYTRQATARPCAHRFAETCVRSATEAEPYWRDVGTVDAYLGGQYRPHRHRAGARPLRPATGRSGPMPRSRRRPSSCMTRTAGAAWRSARWSPAAASSPAPRIDKSLLFTGVVHPFLCRARRGGRPALCQIGRQRAAEPGRHRPRRQDPGGAGRRRGSGARREALPPHRQGHLPDHPADDRPARQLMRAASCRSPRNAFPLVKTGGLADVVGALPAPSARSARGAHAAARLSWRRRTGCSSARRSPRSTISSAGRHAGAGADR